MRNNFRELTQKVEKEIIGANCFVRLFFSREIVFLFLDVD